MVVFLPSDEVTQGADRPEIPPRPGHNPVTENIHPKPAREALGLLALGALGVVYGDIGTSPLYALRECLHAHASQGAEHSALEVFGLVSLIFWSLLVVVSLKYLFLILRADHKGEGGILALTALVSQTPARERRYFGWLLTLGLFGTALLYGDGMITPAISVLSAVEGLSLAVPACEPYQVTITAAILVGLFSIQSRGTQSVGRLFGPIMLCWFLVLAGLGIHQIALHPSILGSLNPYYGLRFLVHNGYGGFVVLGSVFLVVTGGEALYADMGHFGRRPIQWAWFLCAFPALMLNYLGQGALILRDPSAMDNPFYRMAPDWALLFLVFLSTVATIIASQALISGVYSLSMQAVQMGYFPRLAILHTSASEKGQIYVPAVNWSLMLACIALVAGFKSSSNLAAAYGVAVTATMVITTLLFWNLLTDGWGWQRWKANGLCGFLLSVELVFLVSNIFKIPQGGWFPLLIGYTIFWMMTTWNSGRALLFRLLQKRTRPLDEVIRSLDSEELTPVPGMAIYMYGNQNSCPPALLANLRHNRNLHEVVIILSVTTADRPYGDETQRIQICPLGKGFWRLNLTYGWLESPNVFETLGQVWLGDQKLQPELATFFLGRETVVPSLLHDPTMNSWRRGLFAFMTRNALNATSFFSIPPDRVVELGTQLEI